MSYTPVPRHTPGPWEAHGTEVTTPRIEGRSYRRIAVTQDYGLDRKNEYNEANARLIAAAPDMLACIEAFCAAYAPDDGGEMSFEALNDVLQTALQIRELVYAEVDPS